MAEEKTEEQVAAETRAEDQPQVIAEKVEQVIDDVGIILLAFHKLKRFFESLFKKRSK